MRDLLTAVLLAVAALLVTAWPAEHEEVALSPGGEDEVGDWLLVNKEKLDVASSLKVGTQETPRAKRASDSTLPSKDRKKGSRWENQARKEKSRNKPGVHGNKKKDEKDGNYILKNNRRKNRKKTSRKTRYGNTGEGKVTLLSLKKTRMSIFQRDI